MRRLTARARRVAWALAAPAMAACASMGSPPGGPEDFGAPQVVSVTPDSGAVNVRARLIEFHFDEVLNDRGERSSLEAMVLLSPRDGAPRVSFHRDAIAVRPRRGFRPNTTYTVTLLPGVADLRGNSSKETHVVVFSTGPAIATQTITGRLWDWAAERTAPNAIVEATARVDSTVYIGASDSVGVFRVGPLNGGEYLLRAFVDANRNRALDRGEAWDSTTVRVENLQTVADLYLAIRDSIPPRINAITPDSGRLIVDFDRAVDPTQVLSPANFRLRKFDSTDVRITQVQARGAFERAREQERLRSDTAAARRDSLARAAAAPRPGTPPPIRPSRTAPPQSFVLILGDTLTRGATYRLSIIGVRGLTNRSRDSDRTFTVPLPPPPARSDSARRNTPPAPAAPARRPPR